MEVMGFTMEKPFTVNAVQAEGLPSIWVSIRSVLPATCSAKPRRRFILWHDGTNEIAAVEELKVEQAENGFVYQVAESVRCLKSGLTESPIIPVEETVRLMRVMDSMRKEWGLRYPLE